ncbi:MAG: 5'/3'-nucleotidase SurE [Candidatus Eisenbacteria bacterium]
MNILLTNDDGVQAEGLRRLRDAVSPLGRVVIVAPERQQSGSSHALTLNDPLRMDCIEPDVIAVDGTPTDCVLLAMRGLLDKRPDILISGINHGPNMGDDVTYSGTVAAAFEGTLLGLPSVAISVCSWKKCQFDAAARFALKIAQEVLAHGLPNGTLLNVNVPSMASDKIKGVKITKLGKRIYRDDVVKKQDPRGKDYYWIAGKPPIWCAGEETDFDATEDDMVSVTPLHLDMTDYKSLDELRSWDLTF